LGNSAIDTYFYVDRLAGGQYQRRMRKTGDVVQPMSKKTEVDKSLLLTLPKS